MLGIKIKEHVRNGDLHLHFTHIKIWQKTENGILLEGYGSISINKVGSLHLEFICLRGSNLPKDGWGLKIPTDTLESSQKLYFEAKTIRGEVFRANSFYIHFDIDCHLMPKIYNVILRSITRDFFSYTQNKESNYLYFEFEEGCDIPCNVSNSVVSSLGSESHAYNQAKINFDNYEISYIKHDTHKEISVNGVFDVEMIMESLKLYIGFGHGTFIQPYVAIKDNEFTLYSRNYNYKNLQSTNPLPSNYIFNNQRYEYHYELLKLIISKHESDYNTFISIYSQWQRTWRAFNTDDSILSLTLAVSIEGILNDIYIPVFEKKLKLIDQDKTIESIKKEIKKLKVSDIYKDRLCNSISYLSKITAAKALVTLEEKEVISNDERKAWTKLRNSSAHPKMNDNITNNKSKDRDRDRDRDNMLMCINLFNTLIFNVFSYTGPRNYCSVKPTKENDLIIHVDVLN